MNLSFLISKVKMKRAIFYIFLSLFLVFSQAFAIDPIIAIKLGTPLETIEKVYAEDLKNVYDEECNQSQCVRAYFITVGDQHAALMLNWYAGDPFRTIENLVLGFIYITEQKQILQFNKIRDYMQSLTGKQGEHYVTLEEETWVWNYDGESVKLIAEYVSGEGGFYTVTVFKSYEK